MDPANNIHAIKDIAVHEGKILKVGTDFTLFKAKKTIDAKGLIVCPGFIDLHTHVFVGSKPDVFADGIYSLSPDDITLKAGVTTVVDAGTSAGAIFRNSNNRSSINPKQGSWPGSISPATA
ncbi:MAG: amidohydrolase family protein [Saprospiraceae bacterium]|nr:amidohydrolase family protein [Saprospiraceae bacterium]